MESLKGFLHGVARFSSQYVTACSKEPKCKCKTLKEEYPVFTNITLKVSRKGSWPDVVKKISDSVEGVISCTIEKNGMVYISGDFYPRQIFWSVYKLRKKGKIVPCWKISHDYLAKKTEARSTNNTNPPTDNTITAVGECAGNATECSGHLNEKPMTSDKTRDKSS